MNADTVYEQVQVSHYRKFGNVWVHVNDGVAQFDTSGAIGISRSSLGWGLVEDDADDSEILGDAIGRYDHSFNQSVVKVEVGDVFTFHSSGVNMGALETGLESEAAEDAEVSSLPTSPATALNLFAIGSYTHPLSLGVGQGSKYYWEQYPQVGVGARLRRTGRIGDDCPSGFCCLSYEYESQLWDDDCDDRCATRVLYASLMPAHAPKPLPAISKSALTSCIVLPFLRPAPDVLPARHCCPTY